MASGVIALAGVEVQSEDGKKVWRTNEAALIQDNSFSSTNTDPT